ncbi:MAG: hypothetical protein QW318_07675 [Candidatus Caldarchaeum sp.]
MTVYQQEIPVDYARALFVCSLEADALRDYAIISTPLGEFYSRDIRVFTVGRSASFKKAEIIVDTRFMLKLTFSDEFSICYLVTSI